VTDHSQRQEGMLSRSRNKVVTNTTKKVKFDFSFNTPPSSICENILEINISPKNFTNINQDFLSPRDGWFINLSSVNIPTQVISLLQLGEGFSLPPQWNDSLTINFIKYLENNLRGFPLPVKMEFRNQFVSILSKVSIKKEKRSNLNSDILSALSATKTFLSNNKDILFTKADKGNMVVALDRNIYVKKMTSLLSDDSTYIELKRNPINKLLDSLQTLLKRWRDRDFISTNLYNYLNVTKAILPRAYGLPKIHKNGYPLRIIVSSVGTPLHNLASFLHKIIYKNSPLARSHVPNSFSLVNKISDIYIEDYFELISLDAISLFTNVPLELAVDSLLDRWHFLEKGTSLPRDEFISAVRLVLNSTFFVFNDKFYKQTFGTPMGSPLSPVIADLVLQDLENYAL
ncbi:uncharacterized protein LOC109863521, partial [Pseudomyrmex gracilis]|uniref:uncharacterized protein LOC109863521 n=1 Tax=Pseudomyrmex gracilis TaxID=219809 RepID=UPI000994B051